MAQVQAALKKRVYLCQDVKDHSLLRKGHDGEKWRVEAIYRVYKRAGAGGGRGGPYKCSAHVLKKSKTPLRTDFPWRVPL